MPGAGDKPEHRFSVMWMNHPVTWDREMSRHVFPIRDWLPTTAGRTVDPYEAWDVYLDQVHLVMNPTEALVAADADPANPFTWATGDNGTLDFRVETNQLLVRFEPNGERHILYTESATDPNTSDSVHNVIVPLMYSGSLSLVPNSGDAYNRVYHPVRDLPIAQISPHQFGLPLSLELLWPILMGNAPEILSHVPNYRILRVMCDFSCRRR